MKDNNVNSLKTTFNAFPFVISSEEITLTQELIFLIQQESKNFSKEIENFIISDNKYKVCFIDQEKTVIIRFYKGDYLVFELDDILKTPYKVYFENIDEIESKEIYIFIENAYIKLSCIIKEKKDRYLYIEDVKNKTITIKKKVFQIPEEIMNEILKKNINLKEMQDLSPKRITINPLSLSSNFYLIFKEVLKEEEFDVILNKERIELLKKISEFIISNKLFYYIIGSDGIGKSLSLLYYSSLDKNQFIYFNIKLYNNLVEEEEYRKIFYNDLHKFFLFNYQKSKNNIINLKYSNFISEFEKTLKNNYNNEIGPIFNYILSFIKSFP